jgi:hypothetical protein
MNFDLRFLVFVEKDAASGAHTDPSMIHLSGHKSQRMIAASSFKKVRSEIEISLGKQCPDGG